MKRRLQMNNTIKNRYEFMLLLEAEMCNPNGDPDAGNLPRQDQESELGYITDVAIKRRCRNYIDDAYGNEPGNAIMYRNGTSINKIIAQACFQANDISKIEGKFTNTKVDETKSILLQQYWDIRTFGGVLSTGLNAGQVKGAVQIGISRSIDPIHIEDITVTRMCYTDGKDFKTLEEYDKEEQSRSDDKKRTMGNKSFITYGLYLVKGTVSAMLAEKTGFTEDDLNKLFEALFQMYEHDISSSKQGMHVIAPIIIFKHTGTQDKANTEQKEKEAKLGCCPAQRLYKTLSVKKKDFVEHPLSLQDYDISLDTTKIPNGVELGLKLNPFEPVFYGNDALSHAALNGMEMNNGIITIS